MTGCFPSHTPFLEGIGSDLRTLERSGIVSSLVAIVSFRQWSRPYAENGSFGVGSCWSRALLLALVAAGWLTSLYATSLHQDLCRRTRWYKSVDYIYREVELNHNEKHAFLVRSDHLARSKWFPLEQSVLHVSLYTLTAGATMSILHPLFRWFRGK